MKEAWKREGRDEGARDFHALNWQKPKRERQE